MDNVEKDANKIKYLPIFFDGLTDGIRAKAEKELHETESNKRKGLRDLRDFIKNSNLPDELEDDLLLAVLRAAKYDEKKGRDKLKKYCCVRRKRELIKHWDKILLVIDQKILGILPYRDSDGAALLYGRLGAWDPDLCDEEDVGSCLFALLHFVLSFPVTTVSGVGFIGDPQTDYPSKVSRLFSYCGKHIVDLLSIPMRIRGIHALHTNAFFRICYAVISPFLPHKLKSRVYLHKDGIFLPGDLCPRSILPNEFGGTLGPLSNDHFRDQFAQYVMKMKEDDSIY